MALFSSLIGGGLSLLGGLMGNDAQSDMAKQAAAMAQFNPWNVSGAGGSASFNDGQLQLSGDANTQAMQNMLMGGVLQNLGGQGFGADAAHFAGQAGGNMLPGLFSGALEASQMIPTGAFNQFTQGAMNNAAFGGQAGRNALGMASAFGGRQTGINEGLAQGLFGRAGQMFDQDFTSVRDQQLANARQLARPAEERAVNSKFQNLFNRGVLSQTGGERQIGELALAQEQADIGRQFGADQFANQLLQQNRQFGTNLIGQGLQGRQMDQSFNLGAGGLFAGMGQNLLNFGANQAAAGLGAQQGLSDLINSRGQQRLANVSQLLGFGQQLGTQNIQNSLGMLGGIRGLNADIRSLGALGGNLGQAGAAAGANAGRMLMQGGSGSPVGSFLGGLGQSIGAMNFGFPGGGSTAPVGSVTSMPSIFNQQPNSHIFSPLFGGTP